MTIDDLQPEIDSLKEKNFNYFKAIEREHMSHIYNAIKDMYKIDREKIAKAVYEIGNFEGAIEVIESYIQEDFETMEECIVWAKRFD